MFGRAEGCAAVPGQDLPGFDTVSQVRECDKLAMFPPNCMAQLWVQSCLRKRSRASDSSYHEAESLEFQKRGEPLLGSSDSENAALPTSNAVSPPLWQLPTPTNTSRWSSRTVWSWRKSPTSTKFKAALLPAPLYALEECADELPAAPMTVPDCDAEEDVRGSNAGERTGMRIPFGPSVNAGHAGSKDARQNTSVTTKSGTATKRVPGRTRRV